MQVPKRNGTRSEGGYVRPPLQASGPGQEAALANPCLLAGLVNMSRGVAGTAIALDFLQ